MQVKAKHPEREADKSGEEGGLFGSESKSGWSSTARRVKV